MVRFIIILAVVFFVAGLVINPPISSGPAVPGGFGIALDNQPVVRSIDLSPVLGLVAIGVFVSWISKRGRS
mgnify:FL=1